MSIAVVQSVGPNASSAATSLQTSAFGASVTAGNAIFVVVWLQGASVNQTVTGVTDTAGNSYSVSKTSGADANRVRCEVWRALNVTGGSTFKVTVTVSGSAFITAVAVEASGIVTSSASDGAGSANADNTGSTQPSTGAFSTTNASDLLLATFAITGIPGTDTVAIPAGFTRIAKEQSSGTFVDGDLVYQIVNSTQTNINPAWSGITANAARSWDAIGFAYKGASGGPWPFFFDSQMSGGLHCQGGF